MAEAGRDGKAKMGLPKDFYEKLPADTRMDLAMVHGVEIAMNRMPRSYNGVVTFLLTDPSYLRLKAFEMPEEVDRKRRRWARRQRRL